MMCLVPGANTAAIRAVPNGCAKKSTTRKAIEMGMTCEPTSGLAAAIPLTADVTDTAGVKTPSAKVRAVPSKHWKAIALLERQKKIY
jgi:hypothetical protein